MKLVLKKRLKSVAGEKAEEKNKQDDADADTTNVAEE